MTLADRRTEIAALHDEHADILASFVVQGSSTDALRTALESDDVLCEILLPFVAEVAAAVNTLRLKLNDVIAYQQQVAAKLKLAAPPEPIKTEF